MLGIAPGPLAATVHLGRAARLASGAIRYPGRTAQLTVSVIC